MAQIDARGAQVDFEVSASVGIKRDMAVTEDGSAFDLTGYTITVVVKDDRDQSRDYGGEDGSETTYGQTIISAAAGTWTLHIPHTEFTYKEGGRLSYEAYMSDGTYRTGLLFGYITVLERG